MPDYPDPKTRWNRKYSLRFDAKHSLLRSKNDRDIIRRYTIQIANHNDPKNIGGVATCPDDIFKKLEFTDGWVIVYEATLESNLVEFVNFYRKINY